MKRHLLALITPATTATFFVVGTTGLLLFFHVGERAVKGMHEWFGIAMVVASALHVWRNWRPLLGYLRRGPHLQVAAAVAVVGALGFLVPSLIGGGEGPPRGGMRAVVWAVEQAPLAELAPIFDTTPAALVDKLEQAGFSGVTPQATPRDIAAASGREGRQVVEALVGP